MKNYRTIELPDCCYVCKHRWDCYCEYNPMKFKNIRPNGLCDDFEREEE